jgi:hypothetical protein
MRRHLLQQTTTMSEVMGRRTSATEVGAALQRGFEEVWNARFLVEETETKEAIV